MDIVIGSPNNSVDMKTGLETLDGASETLWHISEALLVDKVSTKHGKKDSPRAKVKTDLQQTFSGSYGQRFSINIIDSNAQKAFNKLTHQTFVELTTYFMNEAMYQDTKELSDKANEKLKELGDNAERLVKQLRKSSLLRTHSALSNFGYETKIRHRRRNHGITQLVALNEDTLNSLKAVKQEQSVEIEAAITRLNINTGNGRMQLRNEGDTVAFGSKSPYKNVLMSTKRTLSKALDHNNTSKSSDNWRYLTFEAIPIVRHDGKVLKYLYTGIKE